MQILTAELFCSCYGMASQPVSGREYITTLDVQSYVRGYHVNRCWSDAEDAVAVAKGFSLFTENSQEDAEDADTTLDL